MLFLRPVLLRLLPLSRNSSRLRLLVRRQHRLGRRRQRINSSSNSRLFRRYPVSCPRREWHTIRRSNNNLGSEHIKKGSNMTLMQWMFNKGDRDRSSRHGHVVGEGTTLGEVSPMGMAADAGVEDRGSLVVSHRACRRDFPALIKTR